MDKPDKLWFLVPASLLLLALFPLPYGYYQFLRIAVAISSGFVAYSAFKGGNQAWAICFGIICILFNPLFPVYLSRGMWAPIDIVVAIVFFAGWRITREEA